MLDHKTNFNEFKRSKIIQTVFFEHNGIKLGMNQPLIIIPKGVKLEFVRFYLEY